MPKMEAAVFVEPGRIVLESRSVPDVGPLDALVRISTTTICGTDVHIQRGAKAEGASPLGFAWADAPADVPRSPIGWQIDPPAFRDVLLDAHDRYGLPLYATENGAGAVEKPDTSGRVHDPERIDYLRRHIDALGEAVELGADVRGYFVWSLLDNFEWGARYQNRFGLIHVDYATQRRIPKASARWYAATVKSVAEKVSP